MPVITPVQFTTADGGLIGAVDGVNLAYSFNPRPATLLYTTNGVTGSLLFRNGQLLDEYGDYAAGVGYFALVLDSRFETMTALLYQGGGPTKLRLGAGLTFVVADQRLYLTPTSATFSTDVSYMLFRNGQLLTSGADYTVTGAWITLASDQVLLPDDTFLALISMGGLACTTFDGSINGVIDGSNPTFTFPFAATGAMLFRNGQFLTEGKDYTFNRQSGSIIGVTLIGDAIPLVGDRLTAQVFAASTTGGFFPTWDQTTITWDQDLSTWDAARASTLSAIATATPPLQISTFNSTITFPSAVTSLLYRNGVFMTQPLDGSTTGNTAALSPPQVALLTDVVTLEAWTPDVTDAGALPFNLPRQFSTNDGSITGTRDGVNNVFVIASDTLVTDFLLSYNGIEMTDGVDYSWVSGMNFSSGPWVTTITMKAGQNPNADDVLTAEVFSQ